VVIIGIDPGSRICGYGIVSFLGDTPSYVASGRIALDPTDPLTSRLGELFRELDAVIDRYRPDCASVEKVFFAKSVKSALSLGQARGVAVAAATARGLPVFEYSATEVKKAVVGYGRAGKGQIQDMIVALLGLSSRPAEDSADALAIAVCHAHTDRLSRTLGRAIGR